MTDFWLAPVTNFDLTLPPADNLEMRTWQTDYELTSSGQLIIGGKKFSESDARFPPKGTSCHEWLGTHRFIGSYLHFCTIVLGTEIQYLKANAKFEILINNEKVAPKGTLALTNTQAINLEIRWASGKTLQFHLMAPAETAYDYRVVGEKKYWLETEGTEYDVHAQDFNSPTIPRTLKRLNYEVKELPLFFKLFQFDGIAFRRIFDSANRIPEKRFRIAAHRRLGSYNDTNQFKVTDGKKTEIWKYELSDYGATTLDFKTENNKWRVPVVHLKATEVADRISGLMSGKTFIVTNELTLQHFAENPLEQGFDSWSTHRWGYRLRGFTALTSIGGPSSVNLSFYSGELLILAKPGLWNLDDVWGFNVGMNQFQLLDSSQNYTSLGVFWARSMPDGLDRWFRKFSWFNHPKYLDMNFSYLLPATSVSGSNNLIMNFHGKMMISPTWFVDGGVSVYMLKTDEATSITSPLGTLGFGLLF